jgi:hypothetical protein
MIGRLSDDVHIRFLRAHGKAVQLQIFEKATRDGGFSAEFTGVRHGMPPLGESGWRSTALFMGDELTLFKGGNIFRDGKPNLAR